MSHQNKSDEEHKSKLEDNFLSHIGFEYVDNLCEELDTEKEQWMDFEVPETMDQWFKEFQKQERKRKNRANVVRRFVGRAAVIILFIVAVNGFLYTSVKAYRMNFYNTLLNIKEKFTQIDMIKDKPDFETDLPEDWISKYYPTYLPAGYKISYISDEGSVSTLIFLNENEGQIVFDQFYSQSSHQIDSENGIVSQIVINDQVGYLLERNNDLLISWEINDIILKIQTNDLDIKEIIKIAESVEIKK